MASSPRDFQHLLVTGGCGFIGSDFVRFELEAYPKLRITNLDKLTYAGNPENLKSVEGDPRYRFVKGDICDRQTVQRVLAGGDDAPQDAGGRDARLLEAARRPGRAADRSRSARGTYPPVDAVVHFAAESHVDRSILDSSPFVRTNVLGTQVLLDACRAAGVKRYVQVSTDEVYGSLGPTGYFTEDTPLAPNSPYSASKAAGDLLVRAYVHTFGFPGIVTRCSNNYGPYQFPEKLIPLFITSALEDKPLPVYGSGENVRDWIHVRDHSRGIDAVLRRGRDGEVYNLGGRCERKNIEITELLLDLLGKPRSLIKYVADRPGHDQRYAIDCAKAETELGWRPEVAFEHGLRETIAWYKANGAWVAHVKSGEYRRYYDQQYGKRLT